MEITRVNLVYFSPTQTTRKTLRAMASAFSVEVKSMMSPPTGRSKSPYSVPMNWSLPVCRSMADASRCW